ncbi:hypothetical protein GOP47_0010784 [Adiantum capillus-veneris]|uniref:Uncharacterized protein n=1 Tax=Adiantum capillus-veneris TaxID=13818 RepID=A0A9D4UWI2_ADICA|nr:hypothetical protein GOP47_0010784 [Adiantum capillus-veneris]
MEDVRQVLEFDEMLVDSIDEYGSTAMHIAIRRRRPELVQLLLEFRANIDITTNMGETALQEVAIRGDTLIVGLLLAKDVSELAGDGKTILHIAVDKARYPCMELLLQMGANSNGRIKDDGNTPLHLAILRVDEKAMEILLRHGACKELKNRSGKTPGDLAREKGRQALIFLDELVLGDELRSASRKGNLVVVRDSLRYGSVMNGQDDHK